MKSNWQNPVILRCQVINKFFITFFFLTGVLNSILNSELNIRLKKFKFFNYNKNQLK